MFLFMIYMYPDIQYETYSTLLQKIVLHLFANTNVLKRKVIPHQLDVGQGNHER